MFRLNNRVQHYSWGQVDGLSRLFGQAPDGTAQAEMWMGAHELAPSTVDDGRSLDSIIAADPVSILGGDVTERFRGRLPFLFKVLCAAKPLSLQAHPSSRQAEVGFVRENSLGISVHAAHRNYKDANHKPELICALTEFEALCGFRSQIESAEEFDQLGLRHWAAMVNVDGIDRTLHAMLELSRDEATDDIARAAAGSPVATKLAVHYPNDPGVLIALLLNHVVLRPGEAQYLPEGNLHAYLGGTAVELMANSDNVLRGGLTEKHVDIDELLRVLDTKVHPLDIIVPDERGHYRTAASEFELVRLATHLLHGPLIALCVDGELRVDAEILGAGDSVFVPYGDAMIMTARGRSFAAIVPGRG